MSERPMQETELDDFWNRLTVDRFAYGAATAEAETVALLARLPMPEPRAGFLDALWTSIEQSDLPRQNGNLALDAVAPATASQPIPIPMPAPADIEQRHRWARIVASVAAILVIGAVSALLLLDRWRSGEETASSAQWSQSGGGPGKENANPDSPEIANPSPIWQVETNGRIDGAPVVSNGVVFIGNRNNLVFAFDALTGSELWNANLRKPITQTLAVGDGIAVVATSTAVFGLDAASGATHWKRDGIIATAPPTIVSDTVFIIDTEHRVRALARETGEDRWTSEMFEQMSGFAIDLEHQRAIVTTAAGAVSALAFEDGAEQWTVDPALGALGAPAVADGIVYVPFDGGVVRIDGTDGAIGLSSYVEYAGIPTLALMGDIVVASADIIVAALPAEGPGLLWSNQQLTGITGQLTLGAGSIYLPGNDRTLTALDITTGETQWILPLDEVAQTAPAATNGVLFVATRAGTLYAIGPPRDAVINAPALTGDPDEGAITRPLWKSSGGPNALGNPTGIAVAPTGEVWVCDTANDRLQVFDANGNFLREFGSHGARPGQFDFGVASADFDGSAPLGQHCDLAFDQSGALYIADAANHRVQRFPKAVWQSMVHACCAIQTGGTPMPYPTSGGVPDLVIGVEGTDEGEFQFASDVAIAPNGDIYIGDRHRLDVQRFDANGRYLATIGKPMGIDPLEPGAFVSIDGIAVDAQGRLYIVDGETQQIDRLDLDGSWTTLPLARDDYAINGVVVDELGNIFVAQIYANNGSFSVYDSNGSLLGRVGSYGIELGQFDASSGVALDGLGNIYLTDWALNRFQKFAVDYEQLEAIAVESSS